MVTSFLFPLISIKKYVLKTAYRDYMIFLSMFKALKEETALVCMLDPDKGYIVFKTVP